MFRLKGFFNDGEYQQTIPDFGDAIKTFKKQRKKASCMVLLDSEGKRKAVYLRGLGMGLNPPVRSNTAIRS